MKISPNTNKSFSDVLQAWFQSNNRSFSCVKIGRIESFNPTTQTANIQILHKKKNEYNLKANELVDYPLLCEVPVVVIGGGNSHITFPISKGDNCIILFNDYDYDNWYISGEARPSNIDRVHNITDGIAIVGIHSLVDLISDYSEYVQIKYSDSSKITIGSTIDLQNSDSSSIIIGETVEVNNSEINLNGVTTATDLHSNTGATGSFVSADNKTITVVDGIITAIA